MVRAGESTHIPPPARELSTACRQLLTRPLVSTNEHAQASKIALIGAGWNKWGL